MSPEVHLLFFFFTLITIHLNFLFKNDLYLFKKTRLHIYSKFCIVAPRTALHKQVILRLTKAHCSEFPTFEKKTPPEFGSCTLKLEGFLRFRVQHVLSNQHGVKRKQSRTSYLFIQVTPCIQVFAFDRLTYKHHYHLLNNDTSLVLLTLNGNIVTNKRQTSIKGPCFILSL